MSLYDLFKHVPDEYVSLKNLVHHDIDGIMRMGEIHHLHSTEMDKLTGITGIDLEDISWIKHNISCYVVNNVENSMGDIHFLYKTTTHSRIFIQSFFRKRECKMSLRHSNTLFLKKDDINVKIYTKSYLYHDYHNILQHLTDIMQIPYSEILEGSPYHETEEKNKVYRYDYIAHDYY